MEIRYSIGDVEKFTGVSKDRLRNYEDKGLLFPQRNRENEYRSYGIEEILRVLSIQQYREMGLGMNEIGEIFLSNDIQRISDIYKKHSGKIDAEILRLQKQSEAITVAIEDCNHIEQYLNRIVMKPVTQYKLIAGLSDTDAFSEYDVFRESQIEDNAIIRHIVRKISFEDDHVMGNDVFVGVRDTEVRDCVYTVICESYGEKVLEDAFHKCISWTKEHNFKTENCAYIRPLIVTHTNMTINSFLEIFAPIV